MSVYKNKLVTRVKSLFIPYLCWCLLYFLLYILIGPDNIVLRDESKLFDNDFSWFSFVYEVFIKPIDGPLWFIRNLIVMVVSTPLFYYGIKRLKIFLPAILFCLNYYFQSPVIESLFWFDLGVYFAIERINFMQICKRILLLSLLVCITSIICDHYCFQLLHIHLYKYLSIFKISSVIGISYYLASKYKGKLVPDLLSDSSFIIYAYHGLLTLLLPQLFINIFSSLLGCELLTYLLTITIIIIGGVFLSYVIHRNELLRSIFSGR